MRAKHLVFWSWLLVTVWAVVDPIPDKFNAYVFSYPLFAIAIGMGTEIVLAQLARRPTGKPNRSPTVRSLALLALALPPIVLYSLAPVLTKRLGVDLVHSRPCPFRDNNRYFLTPSKRGDYGPRQYSDAALRAVAPHAVLIADYTLWRPLKYTQVVFGARPDVQLLFVEPLQRGGVDNFLEENIDKNPLYLASNTPSEYYDLDRVTPRFDLMPAGPVFRVVRRSPKQALGDTRSAGS